MTSFNVTQKPGTVGYTVDVTLDKTEKGWKPPTRRIYFTANVDGPAKLYLSNDVIFDLVGPGKLVPVWVTLWEDLGLDDKSNNADGSSSFIFAVSDPSSGSEYHVTISAALEPAQFGEVVKALQAGQEVSFSFGARHEYMCGDEKPQILDFHQPSWRRDGDCLAWRNDLKRALAIEYITINTRYVVPGHPEKNDEDRAEPQSDPATDVTTHWNELSESVKALTQSIARLEGTTVEAHRAIMARTLLAIVILAAGVALTWLRR